MDHLMPAIDGLEFVRRLRVDPRSEHAPIVMIPSDAERALKLEASEAGATDFLDRSADPHERDARVSKLLQLRRRT